MSIHILRRRHRKNQRRHRIGHNHKRLIRNGALVAVVFGICAAMGFLLAGHFMPEVEYAEQRLTVYEDVAGEPSIYVNDQWYARRELESLLVIGVDDMGEIQGEDSYNNGSQADFITLLLLDKNSGESAAIHINRDTMTDVPILGVTGQLTGKRREQIALAYFYGRGEQDSCENTLRAVSNLLYGVEIDHYIAVTMDAVPILNDWAGGVSVDLLDDFTDVNTRFKKGSNQLLNSNEALIYVQARAGVGDASNLGRMQRQRQYARAWFEQAGHLFRNYESVAELLSSLQDYSYTNCGLEELKSLLDSFSRNPPERILELQGEAVVQDIYMEYHVDEAALQALVLELFYVPVED